MSLIKCQKPWQATKEQEIKSLKEFIVNFTTLRHQYSWPAHSLKKLEELTNRSWTLQQVRDDIKKHGEKDN